MYYNVSDTFVDVVGALDVDWTSLMPTNSRDHQEEKETSDVLQRFNPENVFSKLGISKKYAGAKRTAKVNELLHKTGGELIFSLFPLSLTKISLTAEALQSHIIPITDLKFV